MSNCTECIHRDTCYYLVEYGEEPYRRCIHYKDESRMIESPCPMGTKLYIRNAVKHSDEVWAQPVTVVGLHLRDTESYRGLKREEYLVVRGSYGFSKHIPFSHIGKKVFFTEMDAKMYGKEEKYV